VPATRSSGPPQSIAVSSAVSVKSFFFPCSPGLAGPKRDQMDE
jgi:hypothetical protein